MSKKINIRPTTSVYATYQHIKYDPWTAIAEFVDNSTQSYYDNKKKLEETKYWKGLEVEIEYKKDEKGEEYLEIRDNACGMNYHDFQRAIVLDSRPVNPSRSEFGMGLKTAACWFGKKWSVESTELGSDVKYKTTIDVEMLRKYRNEEVEVEEEHSNPREHYTIIRIWDLNRKLSGRQIGKTKAQLTGMYRVDLRSGDIKIYYNGEGLSYVEPVIFKEVLTDGSTKEWRKDVDFSIEHEGQSYGVNGFIALREEGSTSGAGLTLIRRGRVIVGGYENAYRPEEVFEKTNSFVYQRLFGELNLDEWPVTQTKDSFDWYNGLEDVFIEKLVEVCKDYSKKAKEYRVRPKNIGKADVQKLVQAFSDKGIIENATTSALVPSTSDNEKETVSTNVQGEIVNEQTTMEFIQNQTPMPKPESENCSNVEKEDEGKRISFICNGRNYIFNFIPKKDNPRANWLNISAESEEEYTIEWNTKHPFFDKVADDPDFMEVMQMFIFAMALSEIESRRLETSGKIDAGAIRMQMNETLKSIMEGK